MQPSPRTRCSGSWRLLGGNEGDLWGCTVVVLQAPWQMLLAQPGGGEKVGCPGGTNQEMVRDLKKSKHPKTTVIKAWGPQGAREPRISGTSCY